MKRSAKSVKPTRHDPDPPAHLDALALEEWVRITSALSEAGLLIRADRAVLGAYCGAVADLTRAEDALRGQPILLTSEKTGGAYQNPLLSIVRHAREAVRKLAAEIGATPSARSMKPTKAATADDQNPFAAISGGKSRR